MKEEGYEEEHDSPTQEPPATREPMGSEICDSSSTGYYQLASSVASIFSSPDANQDN